jgi:hypothetical protein
MKWPYFRGLYLRRDEKINKRTAGQAGEGKGVIKGIFLRRDQGLYRISPDLVPGIIEMNAVGLIIIEIDNRLRVFEQRVNIYKRDALLITERLNLWIIGFG